MDCRRKRRRTLSAIHGLLTSGVWLEPGKRLQPAATVVHVLQSRKMAKYWLPTEPDKRTTAFRLDKLLRLAIPEFWPRAADPGKGRCQRTGTGLGRAIGFLRYVRGSSGRFIVTPVELLFLLLIPATAQGEHLAALAADFETPA